VLQADRGYDWRTRQRTHLLTHPDAPCNGARLIRALPRTQIDFSEVLK
jgi:hypothetical protein